MFMGAVGRGSTLGQVEQEVAGVSRGFCLALFQDEGCGQALEEYVL